MIRNFVKIANKLDDLGLTREADILDNWIVKMAAGTDTDLVGTFKGMILTAITNPTKADASFAQQAAESVNSKFNKIRTGAENIENLIGTRSFFTTSFFASNPELKRKLDEGKYKTVLAGINQIINNPQGASSASAAPQAMVAGVASTPAATPAAKPAASGTGAAPASKKAPAKSTGTSGDNKASTRDWAYYTSKQTDQFGKNMELFWRKLSEHIGLDSTYSSFVKYYNDKAKKYNKNINPGELISILSSDAISTSKDPLIKYLYSSGYISSDKKIGSLAYTYIGYNTAEGRPATNEEKMSAGEEMKTIIDGLKTEKSNWDQLIYAAEGDEEIRKEMKAAWEELSRVDKSEDRMPGDYNSFMKWLRKNKLTSYSSSAILQRLRKDISNSNVQSNPK